MTRPLPPRDKLTICFAHVAYRMAERFALRNTGIKHFQVNNAGDLNARIGEADVLSLSMLWENDLIAKAPRLGFIQSIGAGTDRFSNDMLKAAGIRLASAGGVNANAVSEHAMALILSFTRQLHLCRDNQAKRFWRGMISDLSQREDELGGKTLLIVGLGRIGKRLASLASAFGMRVMATKRDPSQGAPGVAVHAQDRFVDLVPQADFIALTCPLTPQTENLVNARVLAAMKPSAVLINVARGKVVDEPALVAALDDKRIAGAGLDCTVEEPLPGTSPLWGMDNVVITPHTAGETRAYEDNVIDILLENLDRIWRGEATLRNQVV